MSTNGFVIFVLILVQVLFGINFTTSKIVVTQLDPMLWSNLRFLAAGLIMLFFSIVLRRPHPQISKSFIKNIIFLSLLGMSLGQTLFMIGLKYTSSINASVISTTIPILTLFISIIRGRATLTALKAIGITMAFIGILTIKGIENVTFTVETLRGDLMVFLSSLCFALFLSYSGEFIKKHDNFWSTTWMFLISGVLMTGINFSNLSDFSQLELTHNLIFAASFSIIGATVLTYFLNNWALVRVSGAKVSLFIYLQPVVATMIGTMFLGEVLTFRVIFSGVLIFGGLLFSLIESRKTA